MKKLLLPLLIIITVICHSQVLIKKDRPLNQNSNSKIVNPSSNDKLDQIFGNSERAFSSFLIAERPNKTTRSIDRNFILQDDEGIEYMLKKNEYPLDIIQDKLYTFIENVEDQKRDYIIYDIKSNNGLEKIASLTLSLSSTASVLKNGDVIVTEGGHSGRDWIRLYSNELNMIHEFQFKKSHC